MPVPKLFKRLGMVAPVFQAPIGAVASVELAAAISAAGGLGHLACTWRNPDQLREMFSAVQALTKENLQNYDIFNVAGGVSPSILAEEGTTTKSMVTTSLVWDRRDNPFLTRRGERISISS